MTARSHARFGHMVPARTKGRRALSPHPIFSTRLFPKKRELKFTRVRRDGENAPANARQYAIPRNDREDRESIDVRSNSTGPT
jgi:hypothetical protein